jgi:hypothetical protein
MNDITFLAYGIKMGKHESPEDFRRRVREMLSRLLGIKSPSNEFVRRLGGGES